MSDNSMQSKGYDWIHAPTPANRGVFPSPPTCVPRGRGSRVPLPVDCGAPGFAVEVFANKCRIRTASAPESGLSSALWLEESWEYVLCLKSTFHGRGGVGIFVQKPCPSLSETAEVDKNHDFQYYWLLNSLLRRHLWATVLARPLRCPFFRAFVGMERGFPNG